MGNASLRSEIFACEQQTGSFIATCDRLDFHYLRRGRVRAGNEQASFVLTQHGRPIIVTQKHSNTFIRLLASFRRHRIGHISKEGNFRQALKRKSESRTRSPRSPRERDANVQAPRVW